MSSFALLTKTMVSSIIVGLWNVPDIFRGQLISDPILPFQKFQSANRILHCFFYYLFRLSLKLYILSPLEILNLFNMLLLRKTWESEMTRRSVAVL